MTRPDDSINISFKPLGDGGNAGLTKREYFAAMAMQGLQSSNFDDNFNQSFGASEISRLSVGMADSLIKQLNKEETK